MLVDNEDLEKIKDFDWKELKLIFTVWRSVAGYCGARLGKVRI